MATTDFDQQFQTTMDASAEPEDELAASSMSLVDHLEELRWRIFKCLIAITIGSIIAFVFRSQIMSFLQAPLPLQANALDHSGDNKLVVMGLTEGFTMTLIISVIVGIILALPVLLYQTWAFVSPRLYAHEKKYAVPFIAIGLVLFVAGVMLGYLVLRYPVAWLTEFGQGSGFVELVTATSYFTFVAMFLLVFGLIFELPLVLTFLAKVGLVSVETLQRKRATAHLVMWSASCFATPGADIYSPIIIGAALSCLYELSIIFIRVAVKPVIAEEIA